MWKWKLLAALSAAMLLFAACASMGAPQTDGSGQAPKPVPTVQKTVCSKLHAVVSGETLLSIAQAEGVTLDALMHANSGISNPNRIQAEDMICIPAAVVPTPKVGLDEAFSLGMVADCTKAGVIQKIWLDANAYSLTAALGNPPLDNGGKKTDWWKWTAQSAELVITLEFCEGNDQIKGFRITSASNGWACSIGDNIPMVP